MNKLSDRRVAFSILKSFGRCWYCGQKLDIKNLTFDHFIPKSFGGEYDYENIVPCCKACNSWKADMSIEQFRSIVFEAMKGTARFFGIQPKEPQDIKFYFERLKDNEIYEQIEKALNDI